jgi:hypothetical protein
MPALGIPRLNDGGGASGVEEEELQTLLLQRFTI